MLDYKPNIVLSTKEYKVVGTRPIRHDGLDKVTGRARYGADILLPGLLYGKILRSPHAHARIKRIDVSKALKLPGVKAVVTGADFGRIPDEANVVAEGGYQNLGFMSQNVMARDKVLYPGHPVAGVAATSQHIAEEALSLIQVEYELLPGVFDALEAMKENAPILHERLKTMTTLMGPGGTRSAGEEGAPTNIAKHFEISLGDVEKGFREADVIVERQYFTQRSHQGYIEPTTATVLCDKEGNITIWSSSQGQFAMREQTAAILGIPESKIKAIPMEIGGGFGGKTCTYLEPVAALLSRKAGQPVKITMTRTEVLTVAGPTSEGYVWVKVGATKQGRLTAVQSKLVFEGGAYPGSPVGGAARCMLGPYDIPNAHLDCYDVVVNKSKTSAYRAPGAPTGAFAVEQALDELGEKLGMDPLEFRFLNAAREGTRQVSGVPFGPIGCVEVLQATKDHPHYSAPVGGPHRGRGIAMGFWGNGAGPSSAIASVNADGTVSLVEGSPDIGGTRVVVAMQLAEVLGISVEEVKPSVGDTDSIGYTSMTGGSTVAYKTGWACYEAAQDIKRQMVARAARIWGMKEEDVKYEDGSLRHRADPELHMTFKQLAARLLLTGGPIVGRATTDVRQQGPAFAAHIVDVEVDPETGKVDILRFTCIQDAGKAIHPSYVEGQMQGGAVQGIGWALNEDYYYNKDGQMVNSSLLDYRMPTALDLPMIDTVIVEVPNPGHPFGIRGVAELPLVPPLAAIANAVYNAIGVRMTSLPMNPARVLEAIQAKESRQNTPKR
jgi:CO/xanthine dehydrogenase Mo-binding subunit